jgi:hypothetical protein
MSPRRLTSHNVAPRKTVVAKIQNVGDLKRLVDTLAIDLGRVHDYLELFHNLNRVARRRFALAVSQTPTFWYLTSRALSDAALAILSRVYDQTNRDDVVTVRTLLEAIEARPAYLPAGASRITRRKIRADIRSVSKEHSQTVDHFATWRNKLYAHRDLSRTLNASQLMIDAPLTYRDLNTLQRRATRIVNRYSVMLFGSAFSRRIIGADDYVTLLGVLQKAAVEARRSTQAEFRRLAKSCNSTARQS